MDGDEIVLDLRNNAAHVLSPSAAAVWNCCDGDTSTISIAEHVGMPIVAVDTALAELESAGLLVPAGVSRRKVLLTGAFAGAVAVTSVALPTAANAASTPGGGGGGPETMPGTITGQVTNASSGVPISGATVAVQGGPSTTTNPQGRYTLSGVAAGSATVTASATGFVSQTVVENVPSGGSTTENFALAPVNTGNIVVALTWGDRPLDLDLHLSGPKSGGSRFHCYWASPAPAPGVSQDVDDTNGNGPETDTITMSGGTFVPGSYHIWVHNYRGDASFVGSGGKIVITTPSNGTSTFLVSAVPGNDGDRRIWRVADFTLAANGTVTGTTAVQTFETGNAATVF